MFICHRINTIKSLNQIPPEYGVELDLRDNTNGQIIINHEPFEEGENFENYIKNYNHLFIILNIKSEGIEIKVLELLKKYEIKNYFFLDCSFPMINKLINLGEKKIALRYSEYESIETVLNLKGKVDWVWVDCFTKIPINVKDYEILKKWFKLCFVSPELQNQEDKLEKYKNYLSKNNIIFDAICTKYYCVKKWVSL
jgi:hypothetical protein